MLSGAAWTALADTEVRSILPTIVENYGWSKVEYVEARANGDDCIERLDDGDTLENVERVQKYSSFGFVLTDLKISKYGDNLYFCSQVLTPNGSYPEGWAKPVANLLNRSSIDSILWDQFVSLYRRKPGADEMFKFLISILERDLHSSE